MKKYLLLIMFSLFSSVLFAQNREEAEKLVNEGVNLHDKGDYSGAIARYDKALALDKDNLSALCEKALSLLASEKINESILICQKAIETHPGDKSLGTLYVTYGNALDALNKTDKSIQIYDEGLKLFPDYYQLYFNKGITLSSVRKNDEALWCFQKAVMLNPNHPGSHNAIARLLYTQNKKVPSLLAYCRFLVVEPQTSRAKENLTRLSILIKGDVEQKGQKEVMINLAPSILTDLNAKGSTKENNFSLVEMILSLTAAENLKENNKETEVARFVRIFTKVCSSLKESKGNNHGFYWEYYAPYFVEMNKQKFVETFAHIAFATSNDTENNKWLNAHESDISLFYEWSKTFAWIKI